MTTISAAAVKSLRERTGAGMMDCKTALQENEGDMERAIDALRSKGLARAAKRSGRETLSGGVFVHLSGHRLSGHGGVALELNSETDFVARNDAFRKLAASLAARALALGDLDLDAFKAAPLNDDADAPSVAEGIAAAAAVVGENLRLRRLARLEVAKGRAAGYTHNVIAPGLGQIGVIVGIGCDRAGRDGAECPELETFGKQIAMHIAAENPLAVSSDDLPADVVARERAVLIEGARESGKPEAIVEKMIAGRLNKYFKEVSLLSQPFVVDPDRTVADALKEIGERIGAETTITGFIRMQLSEPLDGASDAG